MRKRKPCSGIARFCSAPLILYLLAGCGGGGTAAPAAQYAIGGTATGLMQGASLTLLDNGGNALTLTQNGSFMFTGSLAGGVHYAVTVGTQPTGQTCLIANGSGTASAAVSNVAVSCTTNTYTVGGMISGLTSSGLVLANGTDVLAVSPSSTSFTMPTAIAYGGVYEITVKTQPVASA